MCLSPPIDCLQVCLACKGCAGTNQSKLRSVCLIDDGVYVRMCGASSLCWWSGFRPGRCLGDANTGCRICLPLSRGVPFAGHACSFGFFCKTSFASGVLVPIHPLIQL
jgi:hypothetical protein